MKKLFTCLALVFVMLLSIGAPQSAYAGFAERPVGFVVIDKSGNVDGSIYKSWRSVVRWAYHFPDYQIVDSGVPQEVVGSMLKDNVKVDKNVMAALAQKSDVDVLVVVKVYDMNDMLYNGFSSPFEDDGSYVLVELAADLYVYKTEGDKFLKKRLRERAIKDLGNYEKPQETIKWKLSDLVNTMEGRELIR